MKVEIIETIVLLVCICCWSVTSENRRKIKIPSTDSRNVIEDATVHIIKTCFPHFKNIITMVYKNESNGQQVLESSTRFDMISTLFDLNSYHHNNIKIKDQIDALIVISRRNEEEKFTRIRKYDKLNIFNAAVLFIVHNWPNYYCSDAYINLHEGRRLQFLRSYFVCFDFDKKLKVYTSNPDFEWAPSVWKYEESDKEDPNNPYLKPLTIYSRPYIKESICDDLNFDMKKNLTGYNLTIASLGKKYGKKGFDEQIVKALLQALNVGIKNENISSHSEVRQRMKKKIFDLFTESQNINVHSGNLEPYIITYPVMYTTIEMVTHKRALLTPLEKIYNYYGYLIVLATIIILLITFIVIYLSEGSISFAIFEVLRLLINAEILTRMTTTSSRLFFSVIFLYFLIIHGTFSGRLAEFLTRREYHKNVETLEDLKDPRYVQIYTYPLAEQFITDPVLKAKTIFNNNKCLKKIENNSSVACINNYASLLPAIHAYDLHRPKKPLLTAYYSQLIRKNLPLASRINSIMIWLAHSGLSQKWTDDMIAEDTRGIKIMKARSLMYYRPITFDDLKFSLVMLAIGLISSTICFVFELFIGWIAPKKPKRPRAKWMIPKAFIQFRIKNRFKNIVPNLHHEQNSD